MRFERTCSRIIGQLFFSQNDWAPETLILIFIFVSLMLIAVAVLWPRYQAWTSRFFTIFIVLCALSSSVTTAECDSASASENEKKEESKPLIPTPPPLPQWGQSSGGVSTIEIERPPAPERAERPPTPPRDTAPSTLSAGLARSGLEGAARGCCSGVSDCMMDSLQKCLATCACCSGIISGETD